MSRGVEKGRIKCRNSSSVVAIVGYIEFCRMYKDGGLRDRAVLVFNIVLVKCLQK